MDVLLDGREIQAGELGGVVEARVHGVEFGRVLLELLEIDRLGPPVLVGPCHRAVVGDGALTGWGFGRLGQDSPPGWLWINWRFS